MAEYTDTFVGHAKPAKNKDGEPILVQGKPLMKIAIKYDEHKQDIENAVDENGWLTITVGRRKETSAKGVTHWVSVSQRTDKPAPPAVDESEPDF
jgi:hypothetical protein